MNSDSPRPNVLLCFDFGVKKIGVAVGQTLTGTATPLETIPVRNRRPDWRRIAALLEQWRPQALIVGDPLQLDGSRQPVADQADRFANQLQGALWPAGVARRGTAVNLRGPDPAGSEGTG